MGHDRKHLGLFEHEHTSLTRIIILHYTESALQTEVRWFCRGKYRSKPKKYHFQPESSQLCCCLKRLLTLDKIRSVSNQCRVRLVNHLERFGSGLVATNSAH